MSHTPTPLLAVIAVLGALILAGLSGCGDRRAEGDADGRPVTFSVLVEKPFFDTMASRQGSVSTGVGVGMGSGGMGGVGVGVGIGFSSTQVYLLGGEETGQAGLFRKELKWGENTFTVPLRAGRSLVLTVQAEGGRRGWETVGTVRIPAAPVVHTDGVDAGTPVATAPPRVRVTMTKDGPKIAVDPPAANP